LWTKRNPKTMNSFRSLCVYWPVADTSVLWKL
jgi:hypothetical protein